MDREKTAETGGNSKDERGSVRTLGVGARSELRREGFLCVVRTARPYAGASPGCWFARASERGLPVRIRCVPT